MRKLLSVVVALLALGATRAEAREVYVNGVRVANRLQLKDQALNACDVKFDHSGNVWINAKGYRVELVEEAAPPTGTAVVRPAAPPPAAGPQHYFLSWQPSPRGLAQYDYDVLINGTKVQRVAASDGPGFTDVSRWMQPGDNVVQIIANKNLGDRRLSDSDLDYSSVSLGQGELVGGKLTMDQPLVEMRRTAMETDAYFAEAHFRR